MNKIIKRDYQHVKILNKKEMYKGFFRIDKYTLQFYTYDGCWSQPMEREIFERGSAAGVLLYDPDQEKVVLIEQFRIGAIDQIEKKGSPWLIEIIAGMMELNISPEKTIIKETKEETGININQFVKIAEYYVSPGGTTEKIFLYCAKVSATNVAGIFGAASEQEDIQVIVLTCEEAFVAVSEGRINNASTIIALQWLEINQKKLQKQWNG